MHYSKLVILIFLKHNRIQRNYISSETEEIIFLKHNKVLVKINL